MSLPALLGGVPVADADTYPSWPQWGDGEREELLATLDSGAWWTGTASARTGSHASSRALPGAAAGYRSRAARRRSRPRSWPAAGEGDEVTSPGMTFVARAPS
jgi:hypothetical protein